MDQERTKLVEMINITKVFPGVRALDQVNFNVSAGEIRGLVGKNGAGKTTLMHVLTGIYAPDQGEVLVEGKSIPNMTTTVAKRLGISIVHQHSQLIPSLSMAENIYCGNLPKNKMGLVDWNHLYADAQEQINQLGLQIDVRRPIEGASIAERQMIEIVKALFSNAKVVILDEATAPLPKSEVELLFGFVRQLRDKGVGFIYISHYLEEVFQLCDTVTVLKDGRNVGDFAVSDLTQNDLIGLISGVKVEKFEHQANLTLKQTVMEIKNLSREHAYQEINLELFAGEILGITGLDGCGKDLLARGLFGLEPLGEGQVTIDKQALRHGEPKDALEQGVAYLPRDRHDYGIIGMRPVRENITLSILKKISGALGLLDLSKEKEHTSKLIRQLNIITPSQEQPVQFLSGGNQQKVVFAKLVSVRPKVLLLDEPTQGVDVQAKVEIMKIIDELARSGICVVVISEEVHELMEICDRIAVMYRGRIQKVFDVTNPETNFQKIIAVVEGSS